MKSVVLALLLLGCSNAFVPAPHIHVPSKKRWSPRWAHELVGQSQEVGVQATVVILAADASAKRKRRRVKVNKRIESTSDETTTTELVKSKPQEVFKELNEMLLSTLNA